MMVLPIVAVLVVLACNVIAFCWSSDVFLLRLCIPVPVIYMSKADVGTGYYVESLESTSAVASGIGNGLHAFGDRLCFASARSHCREAAGLLEDAEARWGLKAFAEIQESVPTSAPTSSLRALHKFARTIALRKHLLEKCFQYGVMQRLKCFNRLAWYSWLASVAFGRSCLDEIFWSPGLQVLLLLGYLMLILVDATI
jgi:hypothetical protein